MSRPLPDDSWVVSAACPGFCICPDCGRRTRNRHGWSNRSLQDLPVQGKAVTVKLRLSRWRCAHPNCQRQTFTDRLPTNAPPYARRTTEGLRDCRSARPQCRRSSWRALDAKARRHGCQRCRARALRRHDPGRWHRELAAILALRGRVRHAHRQSQPRVFDAVHALHKEGLSSSEKAKFSRKRSRLPPAQKNICCARCHCRSTSR